MLIRIFHFENHRNFRKESIPPRFFEVLAGFENHPVLTRFHCLFLREQLADAPLFVGHTLCQRLPVLANVFFQGYVNPWRRQAVSPAPQIVRLTESPSTRPVFSRWITGNPVRSSRRRFISKVAAVSPIA